MTPLPALWPLLVAVVLAVLFLGGSLWMPSRAGTSERGVTQWTRFFLVLLRLAIGWHFFFEGVEKLNNPSWSAEAYLRESVGPLSPVFRGMAGDSVLERLEVSSEDELPPPLVRDLENYFERFKNYYALNEQQLQNAQTKYDQYLSKTRTWFHTFKKSVPIPSKQPPEVNIEKTLAERVQDYQKQLEAVEVIETVKLPANGKLEWDNLKEAKATASKTRAALKADLEAQYRGLSDVLHEVVKEAAKESKSDAEDNPLNRERPENAGLSPTKRGTNTWNYFTARPLSEWGQLRWSDAIVRYGVLAVGVCLLLGVFTRTACVLGALFLLSFYLAMPPLPWLPESARVEGHYVFINKNIIELLALLTLATTQSGSWLGLDGLFCSCCGRKKVEKTPTPTTTTPTEPTPAAATSPEATPHSKETPHGS